MLEDERPKDPDELDDFAITQIAVVMMLQEED
jgi:hypothetical protein